LTPRLADSLATNHGTKAAAKKALVIAADAMRVSAAYRLLHRDNGAKLPVVVCWDLEPDLRVLESGVRVRGRV
jgi:hypothetical protein